MKVAIKALNPEHGKEVIKYLESIGGNNSFSKNGGSTIFKTYSIDEEGDITNHYDAPEGYTLIELPKENQNNMQQYKSFAITGSQPLLKAMEETLNKEGFKSDKSFSFCGGVEENFNKLVCNIGKPRNKEEFMSICATYLDSNRYQTFNLPEQWNEALDFILGQLKPKIEVGSWVVGWHAKYKNYQKEAWKVISIEEIDGKLHASPKKNEETYLSDLRLATPEEIEVAQTVKLGDHQAKKWGDTIKFGCQSFTKEELQAYKKLLNDNINAKIEISGTTITKDILDRLINKL